MWFLIVVAAVILIALIATKWGGRGGLLDSEKGAGPDMPGRYSDRGGWG